MRTKEKLSLSPASFGRLAGVSRQGVGYACKNGLLEKDQDGKLSVENPMNAAYLREHNASIESYVEKMKPPATVESSDQSSLFDTVLNIPARKPPADDLEDSASSEGGKSPDKTKLAAEIRLLVQREKGLKIDNDVKLGNLVEKKLVQAVIEEIGHNIQTSFVDLPRRESPTIAALLGLPERERDIEKYLGEKIQAAIRGVIATITRLADDGTFR